MSGWSETVGNLPRAANFKNDEHALRTGMFYGWLRQRWDYVFPILDEDENYTTRFLIRDNLFGEVVIEVLPPEGEK